MEPMKPMKPLEPMKPMEPIKPISSDSWWPKDLGTPSSSGGQGSMRYAFFPERRRLAIEREGRVEILDTEDHHIEGVSQSGGPSVALTSQHGEVVLDSLKRVT